MDESINFYTKTLGMTLVERGKTPQTQGEVATPKSPGSEQDLELNWHEKGSEFGTPPTALRLTTLLWNMRADPRSKLLVAKLKLCL